MDMRNEDGDACDCGWGRVAHVVATFAAVETARIGVHALNVTVFQRGSTLACSLIAEKLKAVGQV